MNDMAEIDPHAATGLIDDADRGWRVAIICWGVVALVILVTLRTDVAHIVRLWWNTSTFEHCLLIPLILGYLVWLRRQELSQLTPKPWLPAAALILVGGLGWLIGDVAGVALLRHAALVGLLIVSVPLVFGLTVARGLMFVLFFALFMIPAGEQLVPVLQQVTAAICIKLLEWSGIPAFIDGVFIAIPNGNFEVAEACSGVRFLIAMIAFSVLVAHLCFKSWTRRILFVLSAIALSILANGIRAFGTIYISYLTTPGFAAGVDHIIYGWIFFAFVMLVMVIGAWRFFDRPVDDPAFDPRQLEPVATKARGAGAFAIAAGLGAVTVAAAPLYASVVNARAAAVTTTGVTLPVITGWSEVPASNDGWKPHYRGASAEAFGRYVDSGAQPIDLYIAVFDRQDEGAEIIGFQQGLLPPKTDWSWGHNDVSPPGGRAVHIALGDRQRDNWQYFLVNGKLTGSDYTAKIEGLKARLFGGPSQAATLVISAQRVDTSRSARPDIERFAKEIGPIDEVIETAITAKAN